MRISDIFNLGRTQYDLDFIDIDPSRDTLLYLEPHFLRDTRDKWCRNAVDLIDDYSHQVLKLIEDGHLYAAKKLLSFLGEPTETCLGQSKGEPRGRGLGEGEATKIMDDILQAPAIQAGVIEELEDLRVFVHGIGPHKMSEAVSNIIRAQLIEYTQTQCDLHGIPLTPDLWSNPYWDPPDGWTQIQTDLLTVEHKQILLVPKNVVCRARGLTQGRYYSQGLLEWHKKDHLRRNTRLVVAKRLKSGRISRKVFKRDLKQMVPNEIQVLIDFTDQHPDVFAAFKANMPERFMRPLMPEEVAEASGNTMQAQSGAREWQPVV